MLEVKTHFEMAHVAFIKMLLLTSFSLNRDVSKQSVHHTLVRHENLDVKMEYVKKLIKIKFEQIIVQI